MDERLNLHRFGPFTLDARNETLLCGSERVSLQPQPMKVLLLLAAHPGELITRKELQSAVWSDGTFVDFDQGLNWCIKRIREVLAMQTIASTAIVATPLIRPFGKLRATFSPQAGRRERGAMKR